MLLSLAVVLQTMQFSLRNLILAIAVVAIATAVVGRVTTSGTITANHEKVPNIEVVLGNFGFSDYERNGSQIYFRKPFTLSSFDDAIIEDAINRGYFIKIEYNALIPQFSSTRIVNADLDLHEIP